MKNSIYNKNYHKHFSKEALIKSFLYSITISMLVLFIFSFISYFTNIAFWVSLLISTLIFLLFIPIFYFFKFYPDDNKIAKRLDAKMNERNITMLEFNDDTITPIIKKQREDTKNILKNLNLKSIKFIIPISLILISITSFIIGSGMNIVCVLADNEIIKSGDDIINDNKNPEFYTISYNVDDELHGYISGDIFQYIEKGKNGNGVIAIAEDGYIFKKWSDGLEDPYRQDLNINSDVEYIAIFQELEETDEEEREDGDSDPSKVDETNPDKKGDGGGNSNTGGNGGSVKWNPANQIIDNKTYYGDFYDDMREKINKKADGSISKDCKDMLSDYAKGLEPKG